MLNVRLVPNSIYINLKLGLSLQLIAKEGKLFQKLSRVAPILGLLETFIHKNHGATLDKNIPRQHLFQLVQV